MGNAPQLRVDPRSSRGGSTGTASTAEQLIRAAHEFLAESGIQIGPRKVQRMVRQFQTSVEHNGWTFYEFLSNAIALADEQRNQSPESIEVARAVTYVGPRRNAARLDPTGDTAVRNLLRRSA